MYLANAKEIFKVVSWSITPGLAVLAAIVLCGLFVVSRGENVGCVLLGCCLFCSTMFLDFVNLRTEAFVVIGVVLTAGACAYVYIAIRASSIGRLGFWAIGAYIHSTYIFNALYTFGHMSFFGAGYTA